jgi:hypothetical protein
MKTRYGKFNPKRKLLPHGIDSERLARLAERARYGGNPEHKRNPGDFGLTPPADPRLGKSLCDTANIFNRKLAEYLLREGIRRGTVSDRQEGEWPKNVWSLTPDGIPLEAQLENQAVGMYHGYPMPETDPMRDEVVKRWRGAHV